MKLLKMASWLLVLAFFSLIPLTQAVAGEELPDEGLKQFPYPYKVPMDSVLATVRGSGVEKCPDLKSLMGDSPECIRLSLVTHKGKGIDITVVVPPGGYNSSFMHELSPGLGKYKFWSPVILIRFPGHLASSLTPEQEIPPVFAFYEIDLVGRFFYHERPGDPSKKGHYHNEVYPVDPH